MKVNFVVELNFCEKICNAYLRALVFLLFFLRRRTRFLRHLALILTRLEEGNDSKHEVLGV